MELQKVKNGIKKIFLSFQSLLLQVVPILLKKARVELKIYI
ncbi:hypothetical protein Bsph_3556 [Lysinibacillus sphaericus C3-41]|uniref:Uncharacterized protein n=1 Tax=Lysinibacillus sphaericus (strain C3-41) TaxID=444177 RepID=B1HS21_LYSSC|nr:hypothetical protein Bsph_3556 [Lysinibacillus sphaericus C3-41]